ncbi:MAG: glycosyltransferase family 39 protein [Deltaproteobacteria bacterium]|nr:glycosyltransferase family 39 protein [Deltaproteobacteria bacterium]
MFNKSLFFIKNLNEKQILLILLGITFILRLYAVLMAQGIAFDSAAYGFMARDFLKGHFTKGLSIPGHPFYPLLISLFSMDTTQVEITGRLLSLIFGTLTIIPLYYLVKEAAGQRVALFSALFYTFHPYLVTYSGMMLTEATYWGLLILSVYFFWTGLKNEKVWKIALSGFFLGLAYLTRPEGIGYIFVYLVWIVVDGILKKKWFKAIVFSGVLISSMFIFGIPYVIYVHQETGQWLISKKAVEAQSQLFKKSIGKIEPSKDIEQNNPEQKNSKIIWITQNIIHHFPSVIYHYLRAYHFSLWLFLFLGLIRVRQKVIAYELFLASLVLFHLLSLSTFLPSTIRFSIPVIPLSLFWAGAGILEMKRYMEKIKIAIPENAIFLFVILVILIQLPQSLTPERRHRVEQKEVGLWLKQNTPPDAIIMSNSPQETFYADREFMMLPKGGSPPGDPGKSYDEMIRYAKSKRVHCILINKNTQERNSGFIDAIQSKDMSQSKDLKEVFRKMDQSLIIYEVID